MMSDDIVIQLKDFAATLKRGEGRSTVYGAASEIERLRAERDQWRKTASAYRYCGKCDWCEEQWDKATGNEQN